MLRQSPLRLSQLQASVPWIANKTPAFGCLSNKTNSRTYSTPAKKNGDNEPSLRNPRSLQAIHLKPLKREAQFGIPSCDLQLRSFSLQPLQFFSDFALRAAYFLGLPASGPITLPRITERWTVPRSHFIFKKSQENFERVTLRRMIQIKDGNPETVQLWLAYLRKHQIYGIGMKANMWEFGTTEMSKSLEEVEAKSLESAAPWAHLGQTGSIGESDKAVADILNSRRVKKAADYNYPIHEIS
ncbi:ribosomal protein S10 domain-containing protein [Trichoderma afarasin]